MKVRFRIVALLVLVFLFIVGFITTRKVEADIGCKPDSFGEEIDPGKKVALFEGKEINVPQIALVEDKRNILGVSDQERWIEVDLSEQKLNAYEGSTLYLTTLVSTGLPWMPTPPGEYHVWLKVRSTLMEGGSGKYYYYLPNVPYVMFFGNDKVPNYLGYSLHGTYWHNDFGKVHSHGCVNLSTAMAGKLFWWTSAKDDNNPGTRIVIHE